MRLQHRLQCVICQYISTDQVVSIPIPSTSMQDVVIVVPESQHELSWSSLLSFPTFVVRLVVKLIEAYRS